MCKNVEHFYRFFGIFSYEFLLFRNMLSAYESVHWKYDFFPPFAFLLSFWYAWGLKHRNDVCLANIFPIV